MAEPAIELDNLTKDYAVGFWRKRPRRALDGLTLAVEQGEIFGFLGPNGAGKTTTVRTLGTLLVPTSGTATVAGIPLSPENGVEIRGGSRSCPSRQACTSG